MSVKVIVCLPQTPLSTYKFKLKSFKSWAQIIGSNHYHWLKSLASLYCFLGPFMLLYPAQIWAGYRSKNGPRKQYSPKGAPTLCT